MTISREIHAVLKIEECGLENRNDISHDAVRRYVASSSNFSVEGEMYFTSRPSELQKTVDRLFRTNTIPKSYSGTTSSSTGTWNSSSTTPTDRKTRNFLTRDPIYAIPHGETKELLLDAGKAILGRDPGEGYDLFCEIIDEIISPPKRIY